MRNSTAKLTPEQWEYWYTLRLRAGAPGYGQEYLSAALLQLIPINAPGLKTMGIDRWWRVYIDFDYFMNEKDVIYAAGVLGHEPWHNLRSHPQRFEVIGTERNKKGEPVDPSAMLWNYAGDLTINQDIPKIVPEDGLFPGQGIFSKFPNDLTTEEYYSMIIAEQESSRCSKCEKLAKEAKEARDAEAEEQKNKENSQNQEKSDNGEGDSGDNSSGQDESGSENGASDSGDGSGEGSGNGSGGSSSMPTRCDAHNGKDGQGSRGGAAGKNPTCGNGTEKMKEYELGSPDTSGVEGLDETQGERIKIAVAQEIRNTPPGNLPGSMRIWADEIFEGEPLDWRKILEGQIKKVIAWKRGHLDYRRSRPHRRQYSADIIRPAMQSPKPRIGIAIDTSGSHLHKLPVVVSEIQAIVKQVGVRGNELLAFGVDVSATEPKPVKDPMMVLENLEGGGGTDMCVGFEQLELLGKKNKIDIGILISDLESGWPSQPPRGGIKYIVCGIVDGHSTWSMDYARKAEEALSWASLVLIDFDEKKA